ncbi:hypothetical protein CJI97_000933 [Candidozyma auris]|nr:hypothetical protein CJI97_000933 [[Candida] auris]QRG37681.1 hypothetical protein FDK38_002060 [[Candida] auris]
MDDDEPLQLSAHALEALQSFKQEEEARRKQFEQLYQQVASESENEAILEKSPTPAASIDVFPEDWQLSQFWYTDETAAILARALLQGADEDTVVCIASAPSVFAAIGKLKPEEVPTKHVYLLEYDQRFKVLAPGRFYAYDYTTPDDVPEKLYKKCHRLLIDPPFLEEECQTKSAQAARNLLAEDDGALTKTGDKRFKLISSTGERMRELILKHYPETRMTDFHPQHKNGLSNEFSCYASFECEHWKFVQDH